MPDRRPTGRPPLQRGDPSISVSVRLPGAQYDALSRQAQAERSSVPDLIRRRLALERNDSDDDED